MWSRTSPPLREGGIPFVLVLWRVGSRLGEFTSMAPCDVLSRRDCGIIRAFGPLAPSDAVSRPSLSEESSLGRRGSHRGRPYLKIDACSFGGRGPQWRKASEESPVRSTPGAFLFSYGRRIIGVGSHPYAILGNPARGYISRPGPSELGNSQDAPSI